jgi:hypothetical protein
MNDQIQLADEIIDPDAMTREELLALKARLMDEMDSIQYQLDEAKAKAAETGEYADPDWFRRAEYARRRRGRAVQRIDMALSKKKQFNRDAFEAAFVDAARSVLTRDAFSAVTEAAHALLQTGANGHG